MVACIGLAQKQDAGKAVTGDMPMSPVTASVWGFLLPKKQTIEADYGGPSGLQVGVEWPIMAGLAD